VAQLSIVAQRSTVARRFGRRWLLVGAGAAALVGAGVLSVIVYPAVAVAIGARRTAREQAAATSPEPRNEAIAPGPTGEPASPREPREPVPPTDDV